MEEPKEAHKTKIIFLIGLEKSLLDKNRFFFDLNDRIISDIDLKSKPFKDVNGYQIYLNEYTIDENYVNEKDPGNIILNLNTVDLSNKQKNHNQYEILLSYSKDKANFIFGLKIGNLKNKTNFSESKLKSLNIDFNSIFEYYHEYIMKEAIELQVDYLENLAEDSLAFLKKHKDENFKIFFEILFFILVHSKNKNSDISTLMEIISKSSINYFPVEIFKIGQIKDFLKEIFSNYEKDNESWPFNFIKDKKEEINEEEVQIDKLNSDNQESDSKASKNEILFIYFFLSYYMENNGKEDDYKIFFINEKIKNKTMKTLSDIKKIKSEANISSECKNIFMKFFDGKNDILGKLQMENEMLKYFELINEKFYDLCELTEKVSQDSYNIETKIITPDCDLSKINKIYKEIISKEKEKNRYFLKFKDFIQKGIESFKDSNLNNLICLIGFIEDEKNNIANNTKFYIDRIIYLEKELGEAINNTIKTYIKSNHYQGIYYLGIIPKIIKYFKYFKDDDKFKILESAQIGKEKNENLEEKFKIIISNKLYDYFECNKNYSKFYNIIINNVNSIEYLDYILQIIPEQSYNYDISLKLYDWVSRNIKKRPAESRIDLKICLSKVLSILLKKKKEKIEDFFKMINKSMGDKDVIEIYIYFLEHNKLEVNHKDFLVNYFIKNLKNKFGTNDSTIIPHIFSKLKDKKDINLILSKLNVIKEEEFYSAEITENIKILNDLIKNDYFASKEQKNMEEYIKKTKNVLSLIKKNFDEKIFSYEKALKIYDNLHASKEKPFYKLKLLFLLKNEEDDKVKKFYNEFIEDVSKFSKQINDIEKIKKYLDEFFKNSKKEEIFKTKELIDLFKQSQLKDFNKIIENPDYKEIIKYLEKAEFYNNLNTSKCFKYIYNSQIFNTNEKNEGKIDEDLLLQSTLEKFEQLKNIFENEKLENISENAKCLLELALNDDKNALNNEIFFLKNYFNIKVNLDKIEEINTNLILFAKTNKINNALFGLKQIYDLFNEQIIEEKDILKNIDTYIEVLKNPNFEKKQIEEIISFLKRFNIFLVDEKQDGNKIIQENIKNKDIFFTFLKLIHNNPDPIIFAKSKMKINPKLLLDFLFESDSKKNLQENDVQGFIKAVEFFDKYKEKKFKFSELIIKLNNALTVPNDNDYIGDFINKYIKNFNGIKTLYNESLNRTESSSLVISLILRNSEIKITNNNIIIEYYNKDNVLNKMDYDEIEELRGKALIMKSYMKKENKEEKLEDTNFFNVRKFVNLIQNFKTLYNYLNELFDIGLPEPEKYIISIKINSDDIKKINNPENDNFDYSNIICKMCGKEFRLKNLIDYLYKLKIEIRELTEKCYLENEYIRFFNGKIFEFIDRNLKSGDFNNLLPIFKSLANEKIITIVEDFKYDFDSILAYSDFIYLEEEDDYFDEKEEEVEELSLEEKKEENEENNEEKVEDKKEEKDGGNNEEKDEGKEEKKYENIDEENIVINKKNIDPIIFSYENMMFNISEYCKRVLEKNGIISCEDIYKINEIKESKDKEKYNGVYISTASKKNNDKKLFIYYLELSKSFPNLSSLLICNEETKKEEIISFLFRVFLCPCQTLFVISKSDSLTKFNKIFLIEKVNEFLKIYQNNMKSILIIFHSDEKSEIKKGFNNIKEIKVFQSEFENKIYKSDYLNKFPKLNKISVVNSTRCGEGKSTFIKSKIKNSYKKYIYFQIGGVFTRKSLFERLIEQVNINIKRKRTDYILHIDLTYTDLNELVLEFLFKFLIMKYYNCDNNIFCYEKDKFELFIEIHNEIYDFEKYQILKFCDCIQIKMGTLVEEENNIKDKNHKTIESSKIQIVSHVLKNLYYKRIGGSNINLNSSQYLPNNKVIEDDKEKKELKSCQQIIDYYFNNSIDKELEIENPNYYQKIMFINLLADQFTRFTKSVFLTPNLLIENFSAKNNNNDEIGKQKAIEIRELIINSLINNIKLFVKGPYENLMKEQKETGKFLTSDEEQNRNEIDRLANEKLKTMVTYNNIKQSILAFDDNKLSFLFKIIPSSSCKEKEYNQLNELYNTQSYGNEVKLKRPNQKSEEELLNDILDLCGAENEIIKKKYYNEIKKQYPSYAFTTDNYIKMVYILMKTRANVPIIMMGETGCGKTSLIKMLSLIKNKGKGMRMKILNIHQGIGDDEIISFLERAMRETKKEDEELILNEKNKFSENLKEEEEEKKKKNEEQNKKPNNSVPQEKNVYKNPFLKKNKGANIVKNEEKNENKKEEDEFKLKEERKRKKFEEITKEVHEKQMWLFFDEINTCNSMGLISEIFCNRTYRGKPIPERFVFIAACNPYRIASEKNKNVEVCLNLRNKKQSNLVYTVNPLPHSLLNYVMDFGELSNQDIKLYIRKMIEKVIKESDLLNITVETVEKCHLFIKEKSDPSSVSLRDIKYFNIFYQGFIKYFEYLRQLSRQQNFLGLYRENKHLKSYFEVGDISIKKRSINLSAYISYFLRLPNKSLRNELKGILDELKDRNGYKFFDYGFLDVPLRESQYILDQLEINPERGIAKNNSLRENIFCELFCLVNKVPLIICGKPGNSKTLSVQLLLDNMKGKSSMSEIFKNPDYKEVMPYPFQGSTTCTSKGVLKAFEKARNFAQKNEDMISLVFFDEMGLAEESIENPLKVLHAELEREDNNLAFFGITNWALDASKMNRGIRIFVQDPDEEDLIVTATEIAKSIDENLFKDNEEVFIFLSKAYLAFRDEKEKTDYKDFHGNRDFYNLIKNTMKYLKEEKGREGEENISYIRNISAIKAIERNFGGYEGSVSDMKRKFYEISKYNNINHRYNIVENIGDNFNDPNSRYLLLISKNSTSQNLIEQIIQKEKKESVVYIGSQFKGDKSESYTEEVLYKIQMQMENEIILILKGLEIIYPSLYDLFNQNFSEFNGNRYAKISFSNNQSTSLINNKFKIVVLVDKQMLEFEDKPFLNRFEKHVISFENILPPEYVRIVNEINLKINELINYESNDEKKKLIVNLKKQLICCDKEVIENLVFNLTNNDDLSKDEIIKKIFELISPTLTQDIISCININGFIEKERELASIIETSYNKSYASNLSDYLKKLPKSRLRSIIYTFSNLTELIFKDNEKNDENSLFTKENTTEIVIDSIDSTKKFELLIDLFYKSKNNLCIIKFEEEDLNKMNYVKNIIDSMEKIESTIRFKYFIFIVYMKRELIEQNAINKNEKKPDKKDLVIKDQIALMDNIYHITIDNLNNENGNYNIFDLISKKNNSIINTLFNIEQIINDNIYNCFNEINFNYKNVTEKLGINDYKQKLSEGIVKSEYLLKKLNEILNKMCKNITEMLVEILTHSNSFHNDDIEILSTIKTHYKNDIIFTLKKIIYIFEKNQIFSSYILYNMEIYEKIIDSFIENIDLQTINIKRPLRIIFGLQVPQTNILLGKMKIFIRDNIIEKYADNENLLRNDLPDDMEEEAAKDKYEKQKNELEANTKNQINKIKELNEILRINNISIIKAFFQDLYMIFLSNKYNNITDTMIKFLDYIIQIYFLDNNSLNNEDDFSKFYFEKLYENHKNKIENNDYDEYFSDIVKLLLFLQNYSDYIYFVINVYLDIYKFSPKVEEEFVKSFINENFEQEKSKRCLDYFAIVNSKLFKIFETLIFSIKKILYLLCSQKESIEEYIIFIKSNISEFKQFNSIFSFYSKEIYTLQNLILVFKAFEKMDKKFENDDLIKITGLLDNERNYINKNLQKELANNLENMKTIFIRNLGEGSDEYSSLFINILLNEYRIFQNADHRYEIVKIICGNNNLIKKSIPILEFIFSGFEPEEEELEDNAAENEEGNNNYENNPLIMNFMKEEGENNIYNLIEEEGNNKTFHQILLFLFECQIENFFTKLKKNYYNKENNEQYAEKLFNSSAFIYFKSLLLVYMKINENKLSSEEAYIMLLKLYSIAYIKRYLTHYIDLKLEGQYDFDKLKNDKILNFENKDENQPNEIKLLKIYMLKLINQKGIDIYTYPLEEKHLNFLKTFIENYSEDKENKDDRNENEKKQGDSCIFNLRQGYLDLKLEKQIDSVKNDEKELNNLIENFYSLIANQYLLKYLTEGNELTIDEDNVNIWKSIQENNFNISPETKTFYENMLSIGFYIKLKSKLPKDYQLNEEKINIILFILKFVLISIKNNKSNIYSSLLNKEKVHNILKGSFLPGMPLALKSNYAKYLKDIDIHLNSKEVKEGAYVCSCGTFYTVQPCGFPTQISKCVNCGEKIGGEQHILFRRDGHIRIFLNDDARKSQLELSYADKEMPNMLLNEYKLFVEKKEEEMNITEQNSTLMNKNDFINPELNLSSRNIDALTFRILNFILYSHIFYSNIIEVISDENIKKLQIEDMSIFNILEEDYKIIQELIKNFNNINDIKEFMNIIYYALEKDIEESEEIFETKEKRKIFEEKINNIINSSVINYESDTFKKLKTNYQENIKYLNLNKKSLKKIINQEYSPEENEYMEHPYLRALKFFMLSNCPSIDLLKKTFKNITDGYKKYPVINKILNQNHEIELLQNIPIINELSNSLRQYYSYNIERKEAKEKSLGSEKENLINNLFNSDKQKFNTLIKNYETSWNNIKDISFKFECRDEMEIHEIKNIEDEKIAFFLVDKSEMKNGMYLAAAYQSLISIQTNFINSIINFSEENGNDSIHKNYIKQLNKAVNIQDAEKKDILKLCDDEKLSKIINLCSIRKCFSKEGEVIFNNYESIEMNLDKIEENLCDHVISQVKQFKTDIAFVTYRFEGYRGKNGETLINYMDKYKPQRKLNSEELSAIFNYIENNKDINYIEFLFDLQKMINYIQEENYKNEYSINNIINNMPSIIHLGGIKHFININSREGKDNISLFTVNSLIDFYNLFEHLCWDEIKEKINNEYKKTFEEKEKQKIKKYFDELSNNCIINKLNLSTSIRRFISKYLSGLTQDTEFSENKSLMEELKRDDLWDYSFTSHPYFEREINAINSLFDIKIGYAKGLYDLLGGDESLLTNLKNSVKIEKKNIENPKPSPNKVEKPKPTKNPTNVNRSQTSKKKNKREGA